MNKKNDFTSYIDIIEQYNPHNNKYIISKFERVKLIGLRTEQLQRGAPPQIKYDLPFNPREIAKKELELKKLPFMIRRLLTNGQYQYIKVEDMIIIS